MVVAGQRTAQRWWGGHSGVHKLHAVAVSHALHMPLLGPLMTRDRTATSPSSAQAQRRREADHAALAPCTFTPDIAPAAGSPLSAKYADKAKGRIDLQAGGGCVSLT